MDGTATTWLAVLAVATVVETAVIVGVLIMLARTAQRMSQEVTRLQREHIEPLAARVSAIAADVEDGLGRIRTADDEIRRVVSRGAAGAADAVAMARDKVWPALGVLRGVTAAVSFLARHLPGDLKNRRRLPMAGGFSEQGARHVRQ